MQRKPLLPLFPHFCSFSIDSNKQREHVAITWHLVHRVHAFDFGDRFLPIANFTLQITLARHVHLIYPIDILQRYHDFLLVRIEFHRFDPLRHLHFLQLRANQHLVSTSHAFSSPTFRNPILPSVSPRCVPFSPEFASPIPPPPPRKDGSAGPSPSSASPARRTRR